MIVKPAQLYHHLKQTGLAPCYLLAGDEPLQLTESIDLLRHFAYQQGFHERLTLTVEKGFDWDYLDQQTRHLSLFANQRLLEVNLGSYSPGETGHQALLAYIQAPPPQTVLLLTTTKLENSKKKTKWFNALNTQGVIVVIAPIPSAHLPAWIAQRLRAKGLQASSEAIQLLAERSEGHLLACAQAIEKLVLLYGHNNYIDVIQILESVADNARFEIFDWVDTVLRGDTVRSVRQLERLQAEGAELALILWLLKREIRTLCRLSAALQSGIPKIQVFKTYNIWQTRQSIVMQALEKHTLHCWQRFLQRTVQLEKMSKGLAPGRPWDELLNFSLEVAGVNLFNAH